MNNADGGQTFQTLELVVSSAEALSRHEQEPHDWFRKIAPEIGDLGVTMGSETWWRQFESWVQFFCNFLISLGYLGDVYRPQLAYSGDAWVAYWPDNNTGYVLQKNLVLANPEIFALARPYLVANYSTIGNKDDLYLAHAIRTGESDTVAVPQLNILAGASGLPMTVASLDQVASEISARVPTESRTELVPWRVEMHREELVRSPFCFGPADFCHGTYVPPMEAILNLARDRYELVGLETPTWARPQSPEDIESELNERSETTILERLEASTVDKPQKLEAMLAKLAKTDDSLTPKQWTALQDLADITSSVVGLKHIEQTERPDSSSSFPSRVFNEIWALLSSRGRGRGRKGYPLVHCAKEDCWRYFVLKDARWNFCSDHRKQRTAHAASDARRKRRDRERQRIGRESQRAKWREQKRKYRERNSAD